MRVCSLIQKLKNHATFVSTQTSFIVGDIKILCPDPMLEISKIENVNLLPQRTSVDQKLFQNNFNMINFIFFTKSRFSSQNFRAIEQIIKIS